jgi:hypothetical protein
MFRTLLTEPTVDGGIMFLTDGAQVKDWLVGNFPNMQWGVHEGYDKHMMRIVGLYMSVVVVRFECGATPHTDYLDICVEQQLRNPHHLWESFPEGWAGEHVEPEHTIAFSW